MTDGRPYRDCSPGSDCQAPPGCSNQGFNTWGSLGSTSSYRYDSICASCRANSANTATVNNVTVHSIGFGPVDTDLEANQTLTGIASCGNGSYYYSSNASELSEIYESIANEISTFSKRAQTVEVLGNYQKSILYHDSYIEMNYSHTIESPKFGEIAIDFESEKFENCSPIVNIPSQVRVIESKVTSYSSDYWTDILRINNNLVFNLSKYVINYSLLGDPFTISIPPEDIISGSNALYLKTGDSPANNTGCSKNNSMIYTALVDASLSYGGVFPNAEGCKWNIEIEPGGMNMTNFIPQDYSGLKLCNYTNNTVGYDINDAYDSAVIDLLNKLDFDDDHRINVNFNDNDIILAISTVEHVPYMWGPTLVEILIWQ